MMHQAASPYAPPRATLDSGPVHVGVLTMATVRARLAAFFIDVLILLPGAIGMFVLTGELARPADRPTTVRPGALLPLILCAAYIFGVAAYQVVGLSRRGQTLGKRAMKIQVVKGDGSVPGFLHGFLLRYVVNALPRAIPVVGVLYPLLDCLFVFRANRRCVHDLIAGTRVVQVQAAAGVVAPAVVAPAP